MMLNAKSGLRDQIELTKRTFGVDDTSIRKRMRLELKEWVFAQTSEYIYSPHFWSLRQVQIHVFEAPKQLSRVISEARSS
jgi:hypothetical protein